MKKLLFLLTLILSVSLFGQQSDISGRIITHYIVVEDMVWNEYDESWDYTSNLERTKNSCSWLFELNNDGTGEVSMRDLEDNEEYLLIVYEYKMDRVGENDGIIAQFVQQSDGQKGTIIIQKTPEADHMISVFLPETKKYLTFDNMRL